MNYEISENWKKATMADIYRRQIESYFGHPSTWKRNRMPEIGTKNDEHFLRFQDAYE